MRAGLFKIFRPLLPGKKICSGSYGKKKVLSNKHTNNNCLFITLPFSFFLFGFFGFFLKRDSALNFGQTYIASECCNFVKMIMVINLCDSYWRNFTWA